MTLRHNVVRGFVIHPQVILPQNRCFAILAGRSFRGGIQTSPMPQREEFSGRL